MTAFELPTWEDVECWEDHMGRLLHDDPTMPRWRAMTIAARAVNREAWHMVAAKARDTQAAREAAGEADATE